MDPEYGHQINPVSRLMQVMQARKENEPKFQLVAEHGQSRYKEFVVEVCITCLFHFLTPRKNSLVRFKRYYEFMQGLDALMRFVMGSDCSI